METKLAIMRTIRGILIIALQVAWVVSGSPSFAQDTSKNPIVTGQGRAEEGMPHVLFLNPGQEQDIGVWHLTSKFMQAAADDLGIKLEIIYAERNHLRMLDQAKEVASRDKQPDFVVIVNEKLMGANLLNTFQGEETKIILMHNDLNAEQRMEVGREREKTENWIVTLTTDEVRAGYLQIQQLAKHSKKASSIVAITGNKATPVSEIRMKGVHHHLADTKLDSLLQVLYGDWSFSDGRKKALGLLRRYHDVNVIWTANDSMGLGAYSAVKELNKEREVIVGGLGGFPDALASIKNGGMKLTVAGHPMIGAWALTLIYDYHHGIDFVDDIGVNLKVDHLTVIDNGEKADLYKDLVLDNPSQIDFTRFSKKLDKELVHYDFSYSKVVKAAGR